MKREKELKMNKIDFEYLRDRLNELENRFKMKIGNDFIDIRTVVKDICTHFNLEYIKQDRYKLIKNKSKQKK